MTAPDDRMAGGDGTVEAPARRKQTEWAAQTIDNVFLSKALPPDAYHTAIDHARPMSIIHGKMRKDRGVKAGLPDWLVVWNGITLWIERKAGSSLSEAQRATRDALVHNGHHWRLARSTEEIEAACRSVSIPLRATLMEMRERIADQQTRVAPRKRSRPSKPTTGGSDSRTRRWAKIQKDMR